MKFKRTKIICTIGPATESYSSIKKLYSAGMNVARLNMSHSDHKNAKKIIERIRKLNTKVKNPVGILLDTQGYVGCTVDDPSFAEDYTVNLKGGPLKGIPEEKYTIRVTYEMDTRFGPMWLLLNHSYTGDFSASGVQRPLDRVESRENTNVSLSWYSNDGATSIRAYVNNLMDNENYYALSTGDHETNYRKSVTALPPRTMGVDMRYRF